MSEEMYKCSRAVGKKTARITIMDDLDCEEENDPVEAERIIRRALSFIDSSYLVWDGGEIIGGFTKELKND